MRCGGKASGSKEAAAGGGAEAGGAGGTGAEGAEPAGAEPEDDEMIGAESIGAGPPATAPSDSLASRAKVRVRTPPFRDARGGSWQSRYDTESEGLAKVNAMWRT